MAKFIPVVCVLHANNYTTMLYEVPLCAMIKRGDKVVYMQKDDELCIGTCITDANYADTDTLEMISAVTHQELPLPKIISKVKFEAMHYYTDEETDM